MKRTRKSEVEPLSAAAGENYSVISLSCHVVAYFNPTLVSLVLDHFHPQQNRLRLKRHGCSVTQQCQTVQTTLPPAGGNQTPTICRVELFDLRQLKSFYQPLVKNE